MSQITSLTLRPKKFSELIGQRNLTDAIIRHYKSGREPNAWMFVGSTGTGKTTLARIIALSLQCTHQEEFGSPCPACQKNNTEFNIFEIPAAVFTGVEDVGNIVKGSNFLPMPPSKRRVYILDEAHMLSKHSQNMLLKYFEDSPKSTVWIICTTEPNAIIKTLRGRCLSYPLQPLKIKGVEKLVLRAASFIQTDMDMEPLLEQLNQQKIGSPRHILGAFEKYTAGASPEMAVMEGEAAVNTLRICRAATTGDWNAIKAEMATADVNDARVTRLALAQYLRTILITSDGVKSSAASESIEWLAQASRTEEGLQVAYTLSILHKISKRFAK